MKPRLSLALLGALCVCVFASSSAFAQSGSIEGTVTDQSAAVLPGVAVEAASPALIEQSRTAVTDGQGRYRLIDLRPGSYNLTFTLQGFQVMKRENIVLTTGFTATVNATLQIGAVGETVTVTSESPIVDTVNTRVQTVVNQALIEALPLPKNAGAFANLIPGAIGTQDVGGSANETGQAFSIHGGNSADFQQFRDGMNSNSLLASGNILSSENPSMLQEVVVETGGFDPTAQTGGGHINMVTKDGGNRFSGTMRLDFSNSAMQSNNLNDALRARGALVPGDIRDRHDYNGSFGGPLAKNKLWFMVGFRNWVASDFQPGNYYNATQGTMLYTPDPTRPAYTLNTYKTGDVRVTWQASPKNKFTAMASPENNCSCFFALNGNISPEAAGSHHLYPEYRVMATWTYTVSPKLLLWAGGTYQYTDLERATEGTGTFTDRSILESTTNYRYGAAGGQLQTPGGSWGNQKSKQINQNFTLSYLTGNHSLQVGVQTMQGIQTKESFIAPDSLTYTFNNQRPSSVTEWATPYNWAQRVDYYAAFVGDQWKIGRWTLNLGLRYDGEVGSVPAQHLPAGPFVPAREFAAQNDIPNFKDINPRLGVAYDVGGGGRTAIKASLSRNLAFDPPGGIVQLNNPVNLMVISATRTWSDPGFSAADAANPSFVSGCNLQNPAANTANGQTCGAINASTFGTVVRTTNFAPDTIDGWYKRQYNWTASVSAQRELRRGLSVNAGYFRTWYGNFTVTDNLLVSPNDYSQVLPARAVECCTPQRRRPADLRPVRSQPEQVRPGEQPDRAGVDVRQPHAGVQRHRRDGKLPVWRIRAGRRIEHGRNGHRSVLRRRFTAAAVSVSRRAAVVGEHAAEIPGRRAAAAGLPAERELPDGAVDSRVGELRGVELAHRAVARPESLGVSSGRQLHGDRHGAADHAEHCLQRGLEPPVRFPGQPDVPHRPVPRAPGDRRVQPVQCEPSAGGEQRVRAGVAECDVIARRARREARRAGELLGNSTRDRSARSRVRSATIVRTRVDCGVNAFCDINASAMDRILANERPTEPRRRTPQSQCARSRPVRKTREASLRRHRRGRGGILRSAV